MMSPLETCTPNNLSINVCDTKVFLVSPSPLQIKIMSCLGYHDRLTVHTVVAYVPRIVIGLFQSIHFVPPQNRIIDRNVRHDWHMYPDVDWSPTHCCQRWKIERKIARDKNHLMRTNSWTTKQGEGNATSREPTAAQSRKLYSSTTLRLPAASQFAQTMSSMKSMIHIFFLPEKLLQRSRYVLFAHIGMTCNRCGRQTTSVSKKKSKSSTQITAILIQPAPTAAITLTSPNVTRLELLGRYTRSPRVAHGVEAVCHEPAMRRTQRCP